MKMKRMAFVLCQVVVFLCLFTVPAFAQGELTLTVRRWFGLGLGSQVRSDLRLSASGPADLQSVTFQIDGQEMRVDETPPYVFTFHTDLYAPGWHELSAVAKTSGGSTLQSNRIRYRFLSRAEANRILFPIGGTVLVLMVGMVVVRTVSFRRKKSVVPLGTPRTYGAAGGTICPRCGRPFSFHPLALYVLLGRLDICEHCGRWGVYRRRSLEALRCAEVGEVESAQPGQPVQGISPREKFQRELDASRFEDQD